MKTQSNKVMLYALTSLVSLCTTANAMDKTAKELQDQINKYVQILVTAPQVEEYTQNNPSDINKYMEVTDRDGLRKLIEAIEKEKSNFKTEIIEQNEKGSDIKKPLQTLEKTLQDNSLSLDLIKKDLDNKKYEILEFSPEDITYNDELNNLSYMIPKGTTVNINKYKDGKIASNTKTKIDAQLGKWDDDKIKEILSTKIQLEILDDAITATKTKNATTNIKNPDKLVELYLAEINNTPSLKCQLINTILNATLTEEQLTTTPITADTTKDEITNEYQDLLLITVTDEMIKKSGYEDEIKAYNLELKSGVNKTVTGEHVTDILTQNGVEGLITILTDNAIKQNKGKRDLVDKINLTLKTKIRNNMPFENTTKQIIAAITNNMGKNMIKADPQVAQLRNEIVNLQNELQAEKNKNKAKGGLKMNDPEVNEIIGVLLGKLNKADSDKIKKAYPNINTIHPIYAPKNLK